MKKLTYATAGVLAIVLCLFLCFVGIWFERGMSVTTGRCIVADNDILFHLTEMGWIKEPVIFCYMWYRCGL